MCATSVFLTGVGYGNFQVNFGRLNYVCAGSFCGLTNRKN